MLKKWLRISDVGDAHKWAVSRAAESLNQSRSGMEQAPGPRGSPHEPQAPEAAADSPEELRVDTAKTESCGAKCLPWHLGQAAFWLPKIRASNRCSHWVQTYSNIGMFCPSALPTEYTMAGSFLTNSLHSRLDKCCKRRLHQPSIGTRCHFDLCCAIHLSVRASRRSRGRVPPSSISSWNLRMSNLGPNSFWARSRSSRNLSWPSL